MEYGKVVVLDGTGDEDADLQPILDTLTRVLQPDGAQVETFALRKMKMAHCQGCFACWIKTPGLCVAADDARAVFRAIVHSDVLVQFSPVSFGGCTPELKKIRDRFVQLILPFFRLEHGEAHHPPRYARRPRLVTVGVQRAANAAEAHLFRMLAGRNAINFHPPSYAAEVVQATDDPPTLEARFAALRERSDSLPFGEEVATLMPQAAAITTPVENVGARRALLVVGSPKLREPSTSSALARLAAERLEKRGWTTETLTLRASLDRAEGKAELLAAAERAGLLLFVFPLYVDALPYLMTRALTVLAKRFRGGADAVPRRLAAIVNCGFPEAHQNALALAICREFAAQTGFAWAGGLAIGGGGMIGGQVLHQEKRPGGPVGRMVAAIERAAAELADGGSIPVEAVQQLRKSPLPAVLWGRLYAWMAGRGFRRLAARNGISAGELRARPYEV